MLKHLNPVYSPIPFSIMAEDVAVAEQALEIRKGQSLVCLGSAGDTALSLLGKDPARIDAVDLSFPQICEIALKVEAVRQLDLGEVRVLLGVDEAGREALTIYRRVRGALPPEVARFWDRHRWMIARGLIWNGGIQRLIRVCRKAIGLLIGRHWLRQLEALSTPEAASDFVDRIERSPRFRWITALLLNRFVLAAFYPGIGLSHLGPGVSFRQYSMERLRAMLTRRPPASYPHLHPFLFGRYSTRESLPSYLQRSHFDRIKTRISRLHLVCSDLLTHVCSLPPDSVAGFDLLNVIDWLDDAAVSELLEGLAGAATRDGRLLIYSRSQQLENRIASLRHWSVDESLSSRLAEEDRIGYYRFTYLLRVRK